MEGRDIAKVASGVFLGLVIVLGGREIILNDAKDTRYIKVEDASNKTDNIISADGEASVKVVPDIADFSFGVKSFAKESIQAQDDVNTQVNTIINVIKALGVDEKSIKVEDVTLGPEYYSPRYGTDEYIEPELKGYWATVNVNLTGVALDKSSEVISKAVENGADDIRGLNYRYSDYDEVYNEALKEASRQARDKANAVAEALALRVRDVKRVDTEYDSNDRVYMDTYSLKAMNSYNDGETVTELNNEPGEIEVTARVHAEFTTEKEKVLCDSEKTLIER